MKRMATPSILEAALPISETTPLRADEPVAGQRPPQLTKTDSSDQTQLAGAALRIQRWWRRDSEEAHSKRGLKSSKMLYNSPSMRQQTHNRLENFRHVPELLYSGSPVDTKRRQRSVQRGMYQSHMSMMTFFKTLIRGEHVGTTIFSARRLQLVVIFYFIVAAGLFALYASVYNVNESKLEGGVFGGAFVSDYINAMKDYVDLCITGIVFLLATYVTTMLSRWWAIRTQGCGALHQSLSFLSMYAAALWPSSSKVDRQARELVARYALAAYQLLFIEARATELFQNDADGVAKAVRGLVGAGTLLEEEVDVLERLPDRSSIVVGWLAAFWEEVLGKQSTLECSRVIERQPSVNSGRYTTVFGKLGAARDAIALCHMYMQTQIPYGFINLIQVLVHMTCLSNSIYCGIHLGQAYGHTVKINSAAQVLIPLGTVRVFRICMVPILLDGMLLIGKIIALPMGTDADDFRAGTHLEALEDSCLAPGAANERYHPAFGTENDLIRRAGTPHK